MSALAEALVAAQRRALSAMEKQYVAQRITPHEACTLMNAMGVMDGVDQERLLHALDVIREYGAALPSEPTPNGEPKPPEKASDAQLALIADLVKRKSLTAPDLPLTKVEASAIISAMQAGTYDAAQYRVPF
jgi:hypothetical protein